MNTEEDTFRILKRAPFSEVHASVLEWMKTGFTTGSKPLRAEINALGWTLDEYNAYYEKLNGFD